MNIVVQLQLNRRRGWFSPFLQTADHFSDAKFRLVSISILQEDCTVRFNFSVDTSVKFTFVLTSRLFFFTARFKIPLKHIILHGSTDLTVPSLIMALTQLICFVYSHSFPPALICNSLVGSVFISTWRRA